VAEALAAPLETGDAALHQPLTEAPVRRAVAQGLATAQHAQHVLRVWLPVGGEVESAAAFETAGDQVRERGLHDAALVMTRLGPGIGEQQLQFVQAIRCDLALQHLDRVVRDEAQVRCAGFGGFQQQMSDAGTMHFDAQKVALGRRECAFEQVIAVAEADLERSWRGAPKQGIEVEQPLFELDAKTRPVQFQSALLAIGDAPRAHDERAHAASEVRGLLHARSIAAVTRVAVLLAASVAAGCHQGVVARMTLSEKVDLINGAPEAPATSQGAAGYLAGNARLGIAPVRFADGPPGVLTRQPATGFTSTMGLAATFSLEDARANGELIAADARALGVGVVLEPYINIHRDQSFPRAYNTFGEDPLLTGQMGAAQVQGIQANGVMAQAKHFIAYDGANDVTVDAQTLHEIYLAPFAAVIDAGVASIMCAYNVINGAYACGNRDMLDTILRGEMKFDGFVTSDWGAMHGTDFINAGADLEMPGRGSDIASFYAGVPAVIEPPGPLSGPSPPYRIPEESLWPDVPGPKLAGSQPIGVMAAQRQGTVSEDTITRAAGRVLRQLQRFGYLYRPGAVPAAPLPMGAQSPATIADHEAILRRTAQHAAVLLKNEGGALPLSTADLAGVALIGPGALQTIAVGESGEKSLGHVERQVSPVAALRQVTGIDVAAAVADDMTGTPIPATQWAHAGSSGLPLSGLQRQDLEGRQLGIDATLDFTTLRGTALAPGTRVQWSGILRVPRSGRYRIYLQLLGARADLSLDGQRIAVATLTPHHGDLLQPAQHNVLPTRDGLDDLRCEVELSAGDHAVSVQLVGEDAGQPVQVRLAWVTPEQRAADYQSAIETARRASKVVVFAWGRNAPLFALPGDQDQLIADIAAANPNTIVVLNVSEPVAMPWLEGVKAVLLMWYPGDEGGPAAADLLRGAVSPGGRLPLTWPRRLEDGPANDPSHPERSSLGLDGATTYSEGIFVGYRWFDRQGIEPLFPFGFGLSYSRFEYAQLDVHHAADGGLDARFDLSNVGGVDADEVPQLYLGPPEGRLAERSGGAQFARRALAAFDRVHLAAGETRRILLHVPPRALEYWSTARNAWMRTGGARAVYIGPSSRESRLQVVTAVGTSP
jgi:beta-glucosidase